MASLGALGVLAANQPSPVARSPQFLHGIDGTSTDMYIFVYMKARRYSIARARAELPSILRAVEKGMEVELSRRGAPVAVILSVADRARLSARKGFREAFDAFVAATPPPRKTGRDAFSRLRSRSPGRKVKL